MSRRLSLIAWALAVALLAAVLAAVNLAPEEHAGTEAGQRLPDFRVACLDGGEFRLADQRGKVTVINLWATWCTPCVKELPYFDRLQKEMPDAAAVLALHAAPVTADVEAFLSAYSYTIPFALDEDGSLGALLGASTVLPVTVIVGPDGIVTYNQSGSLTYEKLLELVAAAKR